MISVRPWSEDWNKNGGWIAKLAMVPYRISRHMLRGASRMLPLWVVHMLGMLTGVHFKNT
jgi:hypothetical protein